MRTEHSVDQWFAKDVAEHVMEVIRDDGLYRHLRFKQPESSNMYFDILTWPGCLCFTGDMGTYVFQRVRDMLSFFRRDAGRHVELRYAAEKLLAEDIGDGTRRYSQELFEEAVNERVADAVELRDTEWAEELRSAVEGDVLSWGGEERAAQTAVREFTWDDFSFGDWENGCKDFSYRFVWCCRAVEWAVARYDERVAAEDVKDLVREQREAGHA